MNNDQSEIPNPQSPCFRIGVTGGIGSGKSLVCQMFSVLGIPIYYADIGAKWLASNDAELKKGIVDVFGSEAYTPEGGYNRPFVAKIAFEHPEKLAALNALIHPAVERHSRAWHNEQAASGAPYTVKEAALMIESGSHKFLDFLIVVIAPEALRIQRVLQRSGLTEQQVRGRMESQLPEKEKAKLADFIIVNDGEQMLIPQVWHIHKEILGKR
jgi:dephospho-CoA kinase